MIEFDPADPFPLLSTDLHKPFGSYSYAEAQVHSELVDRWLGFRIEKTERALQEEQSERTDQVAQQFWIGLPFQSLQTPYCEIRGVLEFLGPRLGPTLVDLGSAYGRVGIVLNRHFAKIEFLGLEAMGPRVAEGNRILSQTGATLSCNVLADLGSINFQMPRAQTYFIYDFGSLRAIQNTLVRLREISVEQSITVVGRGRAVRDEIERHHPWLAYVVRPSHFAHVSFYHSR